jgi:PAS domain-containing protein
MRRSSTNVRTTAEATLGAVFGVVPDALIAIGVEGIITMANPQTPDLFGYEAGQIMRACARIARSRTCDERPESHRKRFAAFPHALPKPFTAAALLATVEEGRRGAG